MSENKKVRITKSQRFEDIKALLNGEDVQYGTTTDIAIEVLNHEIDLLAKKNSADGTKRQTDEQKKNEGYKEKILEFLGTQTSGVTATTILKGVPELSDYQVQKVAALLRQLKIAGRVTSYEEKGKTLFRLA